MFSQRNKPSRDCVNLSGHRCPAALVGSPAINLAAGQVRQLTGGNPNLAEEEAETLTLGFVAAPEFVDGLTVSVDYFDIEIDGAISSFGGGAANILDTCYNDTTFGGIGSAFCNAITRRGDGTIESVSAQAQNVAAITLNGFDIAADYDYDAGDLGMFAVNYLATITEESTFQAFPGADVDDCAGSFGTLLCGEPVPSFKHRASVQWMRGPITAQLLWRYVGEVDDDDPGTDYAVETIDGTHYFDVSGSYQVNDNLTLTGGIDNLLNEEPPILGDNQEQANTYPATYDVFGRTFFIKATTRF
jgi:outer membrane receptor protein involved in Fe transport